ncbi:MAG: penicillin-binding protein [Erysipelotrichaceae bacterium]|nr:penicillin-binding protein [Erysipelotrichaceae bacterium]MDY6034496.1 penicillin-binding protein [Bulleidia sp.]
MAKKRKYRNEVRRITIVTLAAMMLIASNVFFVTIGKVHMRSGTDLSVYADSANTVTETTLAMRGFIYDRNGQVIAQDNHTYDIICILSSSRQSIEGQPAYVQDKEGTAKVLSDILKIDYQKVLDFLSQDIYQTELGTGGRRLSQATKEEIESYNLPGIEFVDSIKRIYPNGQFASNLIGYAQPNDEGDTVGQMGLELYLDSYLAGTNGSRTYQTDSNGYRLPGMKDEVTSAVNGNDVYLTIDTSIQQTLEQSMSMTQSQFGADSVWGGVMEINTGKVLAWGQSNSFDPNVLEISDYTNTGAQVAYEPGSTLKTFTWAAAINEGKYNGTELTNGNSYCYGTDENNNPVRATAGNSLGCVYNADMYQYGAVDFDTGLIYSLNSVAGTVQNEVITPDINLEYLRKFGFFNAVDTDGLPESTGLLNFTYPSDKLSLSFGQGSTVTMLQLMQAYSAIFSDGTMVKPYFVDSIRNGYDNNKYIYKADKTVLGNPITPETAKQLQGILYRVVNDDRGTGRGYRIPECKVIGKTGTTELAVNGSYQSGKYIYSFMGALPAENPQILVYYAIQIDSSAPVNQQPQVNLLRRVAMQYGFAQQDTPQQQTATAENVSVYQMPNLVNHSLDYVQSTLAPYGADINVLGDGSSVIRQYPEAGHSLTTGQRVFAVTNTSSFIMPNMVGWSRQDVAGFWQATGFDVDILGDETAMVTSQSIPAGTTVEKGTVITVNLGG